MTNFSYQAYIDLIRTLQTIMPLKDFSEVQKDDACFFVLRHDVEFSIEKAWNLAKLEHDVLGIQSSYMFQTRNDVYNPFSYRGKGLIQDIQSMGHRIGLHLNLGREKNFSHLQSFIKSEISLLQTGLDLPIDRFSYHRPSYDLLKLKINVDGLINTYDDKYFHLYHTELPEHFSVYYFSDSEHKWKYGNPLEMLTKPVKKLQLLIHPYSWSEKGLNNFDNFKEIIITKCDEMRQSMNNECHHFPEKLLDGKIIIQS